VTLVVIVSVIVAWATPTLAPLLDITPLPADRATALIRHSTVQILAFGCNLQRHDGSGVAIAPDRVLTNAHVVAGSRLIDLVPDGRPTTVAQPPGVAGGADVASLGADGLNLPTLALASADAPPGAEVRLAGFPAAAGSGSDLVIDDERVLDYVAGRPLGQSGRVMRLVGSARPGMSGGPVVDAAGAVVGIVFGDEIATGHALVIPASVLRGLLRADAFEPSSC